MTEINQIKITLCALGGLALGGLVLAMPWPLARLFILFFVVMLPAILGALATRRSAAEV